MIATDRRWPAWMFGLALAVGLASMVRARAHDIPNQRVDRSIQVTLRPGRLAIDYEVSLTELTLTQDLRSLVGPKPGLERSEWLSLYGEVVGPLNAKGFLGTVDGAPIDLHCDGHDLTVEEHPRYTFHLSASIPESGRLRVRDTNYVSSEGTSRLALRTSGGVIVEDYDGPADVAKVPIRPVWALSDIEERRTKEVAVRYRAPLVEAPAPVRTEPVERTSKSVPKDGGSSLLGLLDRGARLPLGMLVLIALGLGATHAIQPGHGKTLVTAAALGPGSRFYQPLLLGLSATLAHVGSVLLIAGVLWATGSSRVGAIHLGLVRSAGFVIAASGLWKLGRHLGGHGEHDAEPVAEVRRGTLGLIGLGLAGGIVPCWEAVGLLVMAAALGRLALGIGLVVAFSGGMAIVLVTVGLLAWALKSRFVGLDARPAWQRWLGLASGALLTIIGLALFVS